MLQTLINLYNKLKPQQKVEREIEPIAPSTPAVKKSSGRKPKVAAPVAAAPATKKTTPKAAIKTASKPVSKPATKTTTKSSATAKTTRKKA
ncbi:MAG: hypothetical protein EBU90_22725 [Proteobacteria bacterium]|nr:hypothetical protein [Pseudomonadota bacterium]